MKRVLVVNHGHSAVCGVHDIGKRIYGCLVGSNDLAVTYTDCASIVDYAGAIDRFDPDVVIVNYRADLMPWMARVWSYGTEAFAVLHQYEEATADARAAELLVAGFDHVLALDPGLSPSDPRVHAVGRPIPESSSPVRPRPDVPRIGAFGFAFPHKGFADVAAEVATVPDATFALHMPEAHFNGAQGAPVFTEGILTDVRVRLDGHVVEHTNDHLGERELIARLAANDVNCLFYAPGQPDAGLSSAIDYLIAARRPMLLSEADMFRAVPDVPRWPATRLGEILDNYDHFQQEADVLYDSMAGQFVRDIEKIVGEL